jgi:hypothetical protein
MLATATLFGARAGVAQDPVMGFRPVAGGAPGAPGLAANDDSVLHIGAKVRLQTPSTGKEVVTGEVVRVASTPNCLVVIVPRPDSAGGHHELAVYLNLATSVEVDWRTNLGVHSEGISPPQPSDWHPISPADLAKANATCRRGRG